MALLNVNETVTQLLISKRRLPQLLWGIYILGFIAGAIFIFTRGSLDDWDYRKMDSLIPAPWDGIVFWGCIIASAAILVATVLGGLKNISAALFGDNFIFDKSRHIVLRNSKLLLPFSELKAIELDCDSDREWFRLSIIQEKGRAIKIVGGTNLSYGELKRVGEKIANFTESPFIDEKKA